MDCLNPATFIHMAGDTLTKGTRIFVLQLTKKQVMACEPRVAVCSPYSSINHPQLDRPRPATMPRPSGRQLAVRAVAMTRQAKRARIGELREVEEVVEVAIVERESESDGDSDSEDESDIEISNGEGLPLESNR